MPSLTLFSSYFTEVGWSDALKLMKDNNIRRLAVTRMGVRVIGIVTERRLLASLV